MKTILALSFLCLCSVYLVAQESGIKYEVFGGYSLAASEFSYYGGLTNGWNASFNVKGKSGLGLLSDVGGYYKSLNDNYSDRSTTYTFLFGPQYTISKSRFQPFAHGLAGVGHLRVAGAGYRFDPIQKHVSFAYAFGGGIDIRLVRHLFWRTQGDYLHTSFDTVDRQLQSSVTRGNARFSTGMMFQF